MTTGIRSTIGWVWTDAPAAKDDPGVDFWLIKAANGNDHRNPSGFDFAANYTAWADRVGAARCGAWTWLYATTDGFTAAHELHDAAPAAPCYVIDVEGDDPSGQPVAAHVVHDFVTTLRALAPHTPIGFTSYPTRAQAIAHGAPWDELVAACDFGMPQVYYETQGAQWETIRADHQGKPVLATFSPGDWPGCWDLARHAQSIYGGVGLWRYPDTASWSDQIAGLTSATPPPPQPPTPPTTHPTPSSTWEPTVHNLDLRNAEHALVTGAGVKPLQSLLVLAGYQIAVDGKAGALTKSALEAFQVHHSLTADGIAGQATFTALLNR